MHRTYQVLRSGAPLADWRTVRLPSEWGAGLHVAGVYSHFIVSHRRTLPFGFCSMTMGVAHSLWSTRVIIPKSSRRCSSLSTASMRLNGTGLRLTNLGTASSFNRSRAFTLVQSPNPGAKTVGYWSRTLCRSPSHFSMTLQSMVDGNVVVVL